MFLKKNTLKLRRLYGCLCFFILGCNERQLRNIQLNVNDSLQAIKKVASINVQLGLLKKTIKDADVITRTGNDFTSQSLKELNRKDKTFSHCGIAQIDHDGLFVYHALGGEWNPDQKLKRESFELFASPVDNNAVGIFRLALLPHMQARLSKTVKDYYNSHLTFDMDFNLKTDDKMYCAEFIYKSFLVATDSAVQFNHSFIKDFEFIGVDDITMHPSSKKIAVLNYKLY
ncbi:MAG: hypothetical protein ACKVOM_03675 [Ferruginibacter sp.]